MGLWITSKLVTLGQLPNLSEFGSIDTSVTLLFARFDRRLEMTPNSQAWLPAAATPALLEWGVRVKRIVGHCGHPA